MIITRAVRRGYLPQEQIASGEAAGLEDFRDQIDAGNPGGTCLVSIGRRTDLLNDVLITGTEGYMTPGFNVVSHPQLRIEANDFSGGVFQFIALGEIVLASGIDNADYFVCAPIVSHLRPTPTVEGRLYRKRRIVQSITGKAHVAQLSEQTFDMELKLTNYSWTEANELASADEHDSVCVWPSGLEGVFYGEGEFPPYRKPGFARNMVISDWSGWTGHEQLDIAGASGKMVFKEAL